MNKVRRLWWSWTCPYSNPMHLAKAMSTAPLRLPVV